MSHIILDNLYLGEKGYTPPLKMKNILFYFVKNMIRTKFVFSKLNIDVTTLTAISEMTSSIFTKLMNPDNKTDMKDVCNYIQLPFPMYHMVT
jgi:hypothetical protein